MSAHLPGSVFISYSHQDETAKEEIVRQLRVMEGEGLISTWDDCQIEAGTKWQEEIERALDRASVAVLLISAHFLTSKFILNEEVPRILRRFENGSLRVMPVILKPCLWRRVKWLARLQVRPKQGRPILMVPRARQEQGWADIADEIAGWIEEHRSHFAPLSAGANTEPSQPVSPRGGPSVARSPDAVIAAETSQAAGEAMREIADVVADSGHAEREITRFKTDFAAASRIIEALTDLKELHDELHNLEFQCLPRIVMAERAIATDSAAQDELQRCEFDLEATLNHLRAVAERGQLPATATGWITDVASALDVLKDATQTADPKTARRAASLLNRVLGIEPSKISQRMRQMAEQLDLEPLRRALTSAEQRAGQGGAGRDVGKIAALRALDSAIHRLVAEHDAWQRLEHDLRRLDASLTLGLEEMDALWPVVEQAAAVLMDAATEPWAAPLVAARRAVTEALNMAENERVKSVPALFRRFRRRAGLHFHQLDTDLREVCGKLAQVGEPLQLLLRTLDSSP